MKYNEARVFSVYDAKMGRVRRKAHSITDLWLLDAPVASEINTRVYIYTFLRAAAWYRRDPSQVLSFPLSINRLCIFGTASDHFRVIRSENVSQSGTIGERMKSRGS